MGKNNESKGSKTLTIKTTAKIKQRKTRLIPRMNKYAADIHPYSILRTGFSSKALSSELFDDMRVGTFLDTSATISVIKFASSLQNTRNDNIICKYICI